MPAQVRVKGTLTMDDSQFQAVLRRAAVSAGKFGSQLAGALKTSALVGVTAAATAAAVAIVGLGSAIKTGLDVGGKFNDLSNRVGDTAGNVALLSTAFEAAGLTSDDVAGAIGRMQKALVNGSDAFAKLGLDANQLKTLSPTAALTQIGNKIAEIEDPAEKTAMAMELFSKSGASLNQIFGDGGALELARKTLGSMPDILNKNVSVIDDMGDKVGALGSKWDSFSVGIVSKLAPVLNPLLDKLINVDTAAFGAGLGADIANAFNGKDATTAIVDLSTRFLTVMAQSVASLGQVIVSVLSSALADPIADAVARLQVLKETFEKLNGTAPQDLSPEEAARRSELPRLIQDKEKQFAGMKKGDGSYSAGGFAFGQGYESVKAELQGLKEEKARLDERAEATRQRGMSIEDRKAELIPQIKSGAVEDINKTVKDFLSTVQTQLPNTGKAVVDEARKAVNGEGFKYDPARATTASNVVEDAQNRLIQARFNKGGRNIDTGFNGPADSLLRQPSRLVGGVRKHGETREEFKERMSGKKAEKNTVEENTKKIATSTERIAKVLAG